MISNGMPSIQPKGHNLWIHDERFSKCELILNPDIFPMILPGALVEISPVASAWAASGIGAGDSSTSQHQHQNSSSAAFNSSYNQENNNLLPDPRLILQVAQADIASRQGQLQVSVASHIANLFGLQARTDVYVRLVDPSQVSTDYIELTIRDQYLSRADMYRIKQAMTHQTVHVGKKIVFADGLRVQVRDIIRKERQTAAGYVTEQTRSIFRSESARVYLMLQLSCEMWDFAEQDGGCDTFFDLATRDFLPELFSKWKQLNVNHMVSIIFFARVLYKNDPISSQTDLVFSPEQVESQSVTSMQEHPLINTSGLSDPSLFKHPIHTQAVSNSTAMPAPFLTEPPHLPPASSTSPNACSQVDPWMIRGQEFRDLYKIVVDSETRSDWSSVLSLLKAEFHQFRSVALRSTESGIPVINGIFAPAHQGNVLEAVNLVLNPHDKHYQDRKLDYVRTGLSIQIITAGTGYIETDKCLQRLTTQRMLDNGVALDLVCLCRPPLHITPVFLIASKFPSTEDQITDECRTSRVFSTTKNRHSGSWDPLYYDDEQHDNPTHLFFTVPDWIDVSYVYKASQSCFNPRMRMPELTFNSLAATHAEPQIPFLDHDKMDTYDANLFQSDVQDELYLSSPAYHRLGMQFGIDVAARATEKGSTFYSSSYGGQINPTLVELNADFSHQNAAPSGNGVSVLVPPSNIFVVNNTSPVTSIMLTTSAKDFVPRQSSEGSIHSKHVNHMPLSTEQTATLINVPLRTRPVFSVSPSNTGSYMVRSMAASHSGRHRHIDEPHRREPIHSQPIRNESYESGSSLQMAELHHQSNISLGSGGGSGLPPTSYLGVSPRRSFPILTGSHLTRMAELSDTRVSSAGSAVAPQMNANSTLCITPPQGGSAYPQSMPLRPNLINPCHPKRNVIKQSSHLQRWEHVYPKQPSYCIAGTMWNSLCTPASLPLTTQSFPTAEELLDLYQEYTYTVSPSESANIAPDLPSSKITEPNASSSERSGNAYALLSQMISLRLSQGFQIVLVGGQSQYQMSGVTDTYLSMGNHLHKFSVMGDQNVEVKRYVRKLQYQMRPMIYNMHIWSRDDESFVERSIKFEYPQLATFNWNFVDHLISENEEEEDGDTFHLFRTRFVFVPMDHIPTSVIPMINDQLDDEELRIAGFQRLLETLQKHVMDGTQICVQLTSLTRSAHVRAEIAAMALNKSQTPRPPPSQTLTNNTGNLNPPTSLATSALGVVAGTLRRGSITGLLVRDSGGSPSQSNAAKSPTRLTKDSGSILIAHAMQNPITGVKLTDRRWHLRLFERVFVGSDCVEWMIRHIGDVENRDDAVAFGNQLLQAGIFVHALQKHSFMDGHFFYRLRSDLYIRPADENANNSPLQVAAATAASITGSSIWFRSRHSTSDEVNLSNSTGAGTLCSITPSSSRGHLANVQAIESATGSTTQTTPTSTISITNASVAIPEIKTPTPLRSTFPSNIENESMVELSRKVPINLDLTQKSDRKQIATMHYDSVHNVRHVFSVQLHWLMCTTWRVVEVLNQWSRIGEKCGLRLVQVPIDQVKLIREHKDSNPFHHETCIKLAVLPPSDAIIEHGAVPLYYEIELIKQFGFVLDIESDTKFPAGSTFSSFNSGRLYKHSQYVHRSGSSFILLRPGSEGLIWIANPFFLATLSLTTQRGGSANTSVLNDRTPLSPEQCYKSSMINAEVLRISIMAYCANAELLRAFWNSVSTQLHENPAPPALIEEFERPFSELVTVGVPEVTITSAMTNPASETSAAGLGLLPGTVSPIPTRTTSMSCIYEDGSNPADLLGISTPNSNNLNNDSVSSPNYAGH